MDALRRKLHDQRGVSMLMALLLMLVALMVSAVVVAGASSAVSALRTDQKQEQAALTVTSAAELIRNSFLASDMKYVSTTVSYEFYYNPNQNTSSTTTQTIPAELAFSDFANYAIGRLRDGQPVLNRVYTFHLEDDRVSDVTATFSMTYDTLDSGETSYVLTAALESTDPDAPYRMTLVMPSVSSAARSAEESSSGVTLSSVMPVKLALNRLDIFCIMLWVTETGRCTSLFFTVLLDSSTTMIKVLAST